MNFKKSVSTKALIALASFSITSNAMHADIMKDYAIPAAKKSLHVFAMPGSCVSYVVGGTWNFATGNVVATTIAEKVRNNTPGMVAEALNTAWGWGPKQVQDAWTNLHADPVKKDALNAALTVALGVAAYQTYLVLEHNAHDRNLAQVDSSDAQLKDLFTVYKKAEKDMNDFTANKSFFNENEMVKLAELKERFNEAKNALIDAIIKSKTYLERLKIVVSYYTPEFLLNLVSKKAGQEKPVANAKAA